MHKHAFVGAQSIYTRAILAKKYIYAWFCVCGGGGGHREFVGGARPPPQAPRSYAPAKQ